MGAGLAISLAVGPRRVEQQAHPLAPRLHIVAGLQLTIRLRAGAQRMQRAAGIPPQVVAEPYGFEESRSAAWLRTSAKGSVRRATGKLWVVASGLSSPRMNLPSLDGGNAGSGPVRSRSRGHRINLTAGPAVRRAGPKGSDVPAVMRVELHLPGPQVELRMRTGREGRRKRYIYGCISAITGK